MGTAKTAQKVIDTAKLARVYVKLRDAKQEIERKAEAEAAELQAKMDIIAASMLNFMNENKMDSIATTSGTFYRQMDIKPSGSDWDAFYKWIAKNDGFEFLERRIKKTAIKEYMDTHKGKLPPGVTVHREYVVRVRRN